jgi:hypothetical protein
MELLVQGSMNISFFNRVDIIGTIVEGMVIVLLLAALIV